MKTYNIIPIGTEITVNNAFKGIIVSVSIRMNSVNYEVQKNNRRWDLCFLGSRLGNNK